MKKKQLAKLKQQFRPSFDQARHQLFREMEKQALALYDLPVKVGIKLDNKSEMAIEFLGETTRDQIISVPLDENFNVVVKRIQQSENGLLERFSQKLVEEFANYWNATLRSDITKKEEAAGVVVEETKEVTEEATAPIVEETAVIEEPAVEEPVVETAPVETAEGSLLDAFKEAISNFPKFAVVQGEDAVTVIEKTAKEDRLLATISTVEANQVTIEPALERKYKLKLEVIPVIEDFASKMPLA